MGLLWTSDQLVAETSTWQHTTLTTYRHPCPGGIRTHNLSRRAAVDRRLRRRGHRYRLFINVTAAIWGLRAIFIDYAEMNVSAVLACFKPSRIAIFLKKWLIMQHSLSTGAVTRQEVPPSPEPNFARYSNALPQLLNTGLFEMIVGVLTTCHAQYTWDSSTSNLITVQQDATYSVYCISVGSSTCFVCWHPSSGAGTAVITASGID